MKESGLAGLAAPTPNCRSPRSSSISMRCPTRPTSWSAWMDRPPTSRPVRRPVGARR
jgi:hypothetical protein